MISLSRKSFEIRPGCFDNDGLIFCGPFLSEASFKFKIIKILIDSVTDEIRLGFYLKRLIQQNTINVVRNFRNHFCRNMDKIVPRVCKLVIFRRNGLRIFLVKNDK
jgi:hypothetical protein